jgi:hypothetical protein
VSVNIIGVILPVIPKQSNSTYLFHRGNRKMFSINSLKQTGLIEHKPILTTNQTKNNISKSSSLEDRTFFGGLKPNTPAKTKLVRNSHGDILMTGRSKKSEKPENEKFSFWDWYVAGIESDYRFY